MSDEALRQKVQALQGPILVLGASGFIGANLLRMLLRHRPDAYGTSSRPSAWRLEGLPTGNIVSGDLLIEESLKRLLDELKPRTILNCLAYGAYSFQNDARLIYRTNVDLTVALIEELKTRGIHRYVQAGSSSEYGDHASGPAEDSRLEANSHYSVSKGAASNLLSFEGKKHGFPGANLRLYSIYGPFEDSSRLVPVAVLKGMEGQSASYVDPNISRDFLYVDDACEAFIDTALHLPEQHYGESFNVGSGIKTSIGAFAEKMVELFDLPEPPQFTMPARDWDVAEWYADPTKIRDVLGWRPRTSLEDGIARTADWIRAMQHPERYIQSSKRFGRNETWSVSAVIACYKDAQAIPIMHRRLTETFDRLNVDYEIIFVNDDSPDDCEEAIRAISARDPHVIGISHSRNFGSQSAFRSGMEVASKNSCVLLDGDLQDPPELIEDFVRHWREGYDVVYGRRVKREAPIHMAVAYKLFYRIFQRLSYVNVPRDAGDFSLMSNRVVRSLLSFPERDLFIRGVRAFVGYKQLGVDYIRPERMFGTTTNNLARNIGWAKKGLLSFSNTPLSMLSIAGFFLFGASITIGLTYLGSRFLFPDAAPRGFTSLILMVILFGSANILAVSLIGEYIAKIFEEVKARPHFIRRAFVRDGEIRSALEAGHLSSAQRP